ncbi:MAG: imidazole glycerol phosphate synthase subunit HisH [Candidatus Syntropharchaeia archaeon]
MKEIAIIDYGLGNLRSVEKGLEHAGAKVRITKEYSVIEKSDGLVLPGVGAFRDGIKNVSPLKEVLIESIKEGKPLLGICLGMQMLVTESEEGGPIKGLDFIPGRVVRFDEREGFKIPQMGWNSLSIKRNHPFFRGIDDGCYVYFVHSYYVKTEERYILATSDYSIEFPAVIADESGRTIGTQFHPEKSGEIGLKMLKNFVDMV